MTQRMQEVLKNPPDASALMEASRSFGNYDLASSLADLIDNSISAGASNISIDFELGDRASYIRIADDGVGMTRIELIKAMRPASRSPLEERDAQDLGRFGLGLKTASFSQARSLTVVTQRSGKAFSASWDLDKISDWEMTVSETDTPEELFLPNELFDTVTEVVWRKLDRVTENGKMSRDEFNRLIVLSADQLSLIFHRYMEPQRSPKIKQISIFLNGEKLSPHDPFKRKHPATQELDTEEIDISGSKVVFTPFILPHFSKLPPNEYEQLAGEEGYIKNQGFYVYRNRRLIIHGTWFKLFRHGELSKLARVRVDIPNTLDEQWRITVDKSDAQIPSVLKRRLRDLTEKIGNQSSRAFRQRGSKINRNGITAVWQRTVSGGQIKFGINEENRLIRNFEQGLSKEKRDSFRDVLSVIASSFPIEAIHTDYSDNPNSLVQAETDPEKILPIAREFVRGMRGSGIDQQSVIEVLKENEPFCNFAELIIGSLTDEGTLDV